VSKLKVLDTIFFLPNRCECSNYKTLRDLGTLRAATVDPRLAPALPGQNLAT
jgi:hypothetical protein